MKKLAVILMLSLIAVLSYAEEIKINNSNFEVEDFAIEVLSSNNDQTIIEYNFGSFERKSVNIDHENYYQLYLENESHTYEKGNPSLPKITRSIIIPDNAKMNAKIIESEFVEYQMKIIPSKGFISRNVDPESIPYQFSESYDLDEFYPTNIEETGTPYILRDFRGMTVTVYPFSYNPQTETLRVYHHLVLEVNNIGIDNVNIKDRMTSGINTYFENIYNNHFLNYERNRYETVDEQGRIIVICYGSFMTAMEPYVQWKNQKGIQTDIYNVSQIGSNANSIKNFIQSEYDLDDGLTFVQLVGDNAQIPTFTSGGGGSDPQYALLDGYDSYPDIFVGRFSAETVAQVETQVDRTVHYERDLVDGDWLAHGMGIASAQGAGQGDNGEADWQHMDIIRGNLMDFTYTEVDQIYDTNGGNASDVANGLNIGRSMINYCGHGSTTSWSTTGFSNTHINALVNDYKLPFINSVACVNGAFTSTTCFAEAWMRATNNSTGNPTGAIATYMSTINQSWAPPMRGQDEAIDLLAGSGPYNGMGNQKNTIGGIWYNGSCDMMDVYGTGGVDMYKTWHIFGDASLQVRTEAPYAMTIDHLPTILIGMATFNVSTGIEDALVCLSDESDFYTSGYTDDSGNITLDLTDLPVSPMDLTLTISAFNKITSVETVELIPSGGAYIVIESVSVNSGDDDIIEFGETASLSVTLENVGTEQAVEVTMILSIDDEYVTLTDHLEVFGNINAGESIEISDAFSFDVSNSVPDNYSFQIAAEMVEEQQRDSWEGNINLTAYAPVISCIDVLVSDGENGRLDPGETSDIIVTLENAGGALATNVSAIISSNDEYITINNSSDEIASLLAYSDETVVFNITASATTPIGHNAPFNLNITADNEYSETDNFSITVGLCLEDFESGDFLSYPWEFSGQQDWMIAGGAYEGSFCAKSGNINDSQFSSISLEVDVMAAGEITFWKKVSCENHNQHIWDYLAFIIDGNEQERWSGEVAWSEEIYPVSAGTHTFEWLYSKDGSVSEGQDCAWLDYVIFPSLGPSDPILYISVESIEIELSIDETATVPFELANIGGGVINYTLDIDSNNSWLSLPVEEGDLHAGETDEIEVNFDTENLNPGEYDCNIVISDDIRNDTYIPVTLTVVPTLADDVSIPLENHLSGNYPNPFNPMTTIKYGLKEKADVRLEIYNSKGQKVRTLIDENQSAGYHNITWNGKDDNGRATSSGIYFYKLKTGDGKFSSTKKMILMK